nr:immunoglobulin light chain junction region [Macaca mulatta]
CQQHDSYPYTF